MTKDKSEQGDTRLIDAAIALAKDEGWNTIPIDDLPYYHPRRTAEVVNALDAVRPGWREAGR